LSAWLLSQSTIHWIVLEPKPDGGHVDLLFVEPNPGRSDPTFFTDRAKGELWVGPRLGVEQSRQRYGGHAKQTAQAAMGGRAGGGQLGRFVVVVDDDIDPSDVDQVLWAIATRCDPEVAIDIIRDTTTHYLDPLLPPEKRSAHNYTASRAIINACRPYHWKDQFPTPVGTSPELRSRILQSWPNLLDGR